MHLRLFRRPPQSLVTQAQHLSEKLIDRAGEAEGTSAAAKLAELCRSFDATDNLAYFRWLVDALPPPRQPLLDAALAYTKEQSVANAAVLTRRAEPPRQNLLRRLNAAPGGTALIVALRVRLQSLLPDHPELAPLDDDLRHLLVSWFNRGFLELRRIDWNSPAAILEKLIQYEAVHAIRGWEDLRGRLSGSRRCYGFFHHALPGEPLIFVEVALTDLVSDAIGPLIDPPSASVSAPTPTTAMFYSISNCQDGLRGISFGNLLIKQITAQLKAEHPSIKNFATLSPVPGLRRWLDARTSAPAPQGDELRRLCALYLCGDDATRRQTTDPVAKFHLSNGARLERINLAADTSKKGLAQSYGVMVNYLYLPELIDVNVQRFMTDGHVPTSPPIARLLGRSVSPHRRRA
ncbi:MAG: malonyl-CoA decarboxylase family protein [Vicinamibacterales bacterium]